MEYNDAVDKEQGYYAPGSYAKELEVAVCSFEGCQNVRRSSRQDLLDLTGWGTLCFITLTGSDVPGKRTVTNKLAFCPEHFTSVVLAHKVWFQEKTKKQREIE